MPKKKSSAKLATQPSAVIEIGKDGKDDAVAIPLKTLVMHGLIAGSTGTGKSRALQTICEKLNEQDIAVFLADIKGDVGGFAAPNDAPYAEERAAEMKLEGWGPKACPANYWSVGNRLAPFRMKITDIDPVLLARILCLNQTQESCLRMIYLYAKEKGKPFVDLVDLENIIVYLKKNPEYVSGISVQSLDVMLRQVKIAQGEGLNELFGMPDAQLADFMTGINVLNLSEHRKRMDMPSLLMLFVMNKMFNELKDVGALDKPRAVLFIDEAHYLFQDANPTLVNHIITILKQIRSKGVSVIFSTQNPEDLPEKILEQLGCKIIFALRAFSTNELKDIRGLADTFPQSKMKLAEEIPALEVGTAIVSPLDEKGKPAEPVKTMIAPPQSFMGVLSDKQMLDATNAELRTKYGNKMILDRLDTGPELKVVYNNRGFSQQERIARNYEMRETRTVTKSWNRLYVLVGAIIVIIVLLIILVLVLLK